MRDKEALDRIDEMLRDRMVAAAGAPRHDAEALERAGADLRAFRHCRAFEAQAEEAAGRAARLAFEVDRLRALPAGPAAMTWSDYNR